MGILSSELKGLFFSGPQDEIPSGRRDLPKKKPPWVASGAAMSRAPPAFRSDSLLASSQPRLATLRGRPAYPVQALPTSFVVSACVCARRIYTCKPCVRTCLPCFSDHMLMAMLSPRASLLRGILRPSAQSQHPDMPGGCEPLLPVTSRTLKKKTPRFLGSTKLKAHANDPDIAVAASTATSTTTSASRTLEIYCALRGLQLLVNLRPRRQLGAGLPADSPFAASLGLSTVCMFLGRASENLTPPSTKPAPVGICYPV